MTKCITCSLETSNPKFCSRSCSAKFANKVPKRKRTKRCKSCNNLILSNYTHCKNCMNKNLPDYDKRTIQDYQNKRNYQVNSQIRELARQTLERLKIEKKCVKCNYSTHVETCHIKPISSFPPTTLISIINSPDNLIYLCPNCHWELDNL